MTNKYKKLLTSVPYLRIKKNIIKEMIIFLIVTIILFIFIHCVLVVILNSANAPAEQQAALVLVTLGFMAIVYSVVDVIAKYIFIFYLIPLVFLIIVYTILIIKLISLKKAFIIIYGKENYKKEFIDNQYNVYLKYKEKETNN